jgi:hypothetical protein
VSGQHIRGKCIFPIENYCLDTCKGPGQGAITHIDDVPFAECSREKQEAALAALNKAHPEGAKGMKAMSTEKVVTMDEVKDLISASKIQAGELFSVRQMKDAIRDQEAIDAARDAEHEKLLADVKAGMTDAEAAIAFAKGTPQADKDKGGFDDRGPAVGGKDGGDAELDKYLDPKKNPFIKMD